MATSSLETLSPHVEETPMNGLELFELGGEFDAFSAPSLEQQLLDAIEKGHHELVIDMSGVTFVDMSTLNVLVRAIKNVYRYNGHLVIACRQGAVLRAIDLAGLRHALRVFPTREEAVESLARLSGAGGSLESDPRDEVRRRLPVLRLRRRVGH
jgi:anti-sigma B factor antagonist